MNLLNLPMETSAVVKKLTPITVGAGESAEGGGATSAKGTGKTGKSKLNPNLAVKAELAQVESLKIQLKRIPKRKSWAARETPLRPRTQMHRHRNPTVRGGKQRKLPEGSPSRATRMMSAPRFLGW